MRGLPSWVQRPLVLHIQLKEQTNIENMFNDINQFHLGLEGNENTDKNKTEREMNLKGIPKLKNNF